MMLRIYQSIVSQSPVSGLSDLKVYTYDASNDDVVIDGKLSNGKEPAPDSADDEQQSEARQDRDNRQDKRAFVLVRVAGIRFHERL